MELPQHANATKGRLLSGAGAGVSTRGARGATGAGHGDVHLEQGPCRRRHRADSYVWGGAIGGLVLALVTVFKKEWSPVAAPSYAAVEGLFIGAVSAVFEQRFPGIVMQAVGLTFGTMAALLLAYRSVLVKATENFKLGVVAATGGIFLLYLVNMGMQLFGFQGMGFIHDSGWVGIGFSAMVVVVAALNLVLDFDFIEQGVERGAPKYMEWYAAFGLLVTLVWLYLEILRLLSKLQSRN
jgi:uncharacterized YccA/Bax inhibitor family protein